MGVFGILAIVLILLLVIAGCNVSSMTNHEPYDEQENRRD